MKPTTLLLSASLFANIAFVALVATRPANPSTAPSAPTSPGKAGSPDASAAKTDALRAALASGDAAALEAAGISSDTARELALGRTFSRLAEKIRAERGKNTADGRWWRNRPGSATAGSREQQLVARRELSDALVAAFGDDLGLRGGDQSQFAFLPPGKRDALRQINQDYDEMMAKFSAGGVQLASDKEKLRLLRAERERDIAALLSPDERLAYEMRTSAPGATVRNRYGDAIESEAEFQKIYALQKALDENFPRETVSGRISAETLRARSDAERQLESDLRAAVGDDRYAALRRAADPDLRTIDSLVSRLNLPATTSDRVTSARDSFASESQRINNDASIPFQDRRAQIQELAARAKTDLSRTLGAEAADAYAQSSHWMNMLQSGMAYSTTPPPNAPAMFMGGAQSVYPVLPAGANAPGAARQVIFNAASPVGGPAGDAFIAGGSDGGNVRVMTFSSSTAIADPTNAPPASAASGKPVIVTPAQPAPAPKP